jgi:hypothetical protein
MEPIYRSIWGFLTEFGDAVVVSLVHGGVRLQRRHRAGGVGGLRVREGAPPARVKRLLITWETDVRPTR